MSTVEYHHQSAHSQAALWGLLGNFTEFSWLPGPDKITTGEHDGHVARRLHMGDMEPIVEYLLEMDEAGHRFRYGVVKSAFVPVDDYVAEVRVVSEGEGAKVSFKSQFTLGDADEAEVKQMLTGAYQMMAEAADQYLAGQSHA